MIATRHFFVIFFTLAFWSSFQIQPIPAVGETERPEADFQQQQKTAEDEWDALAGGTRQEWSDLRKHAEHNWNAFVQSSQKEWVDYDYAMETRSRVDFENGRIEIETVLPDDKTATIEKAEKKILAGTQNVLAKTITSDQAVLKNQIQTKNGQLVTTENVAIFFSKEVLPRITKDSKPYITKDGSRKTRYAVSIDMVPEHIDIRARQYLPVVVANANRFDLDPRLVMAIIHTESYFNPLAISSSGAVGLMQIIPKHAGREAYRYLYGQDWTIRADYLYSPGINIELGTAYLYLLMNRYFAHVNDPVKRRFISICAYNWGPTAMRENILNRYGTAAMDSSTLYALLRGQTPL
jgi:membrane-bound lytic murein transglycosylase C